VCPAEINPVMMKLITRNKPLPEIKAFMTKAARTPGNNRIRMSLDAVPKIHMDYWNSIKPC
jgi:hypothetical protein